jgi:hypothetical protein
MAGGVAFVALAGRGKRAQDKDKGDASVPTPHNPSPAPTGCEANFGITRWNVCGAHFYSFAPAIEEIA